MKYLLIALLLTGCCTPKKIYVDRFTTVKTCPQVEGIDLTRPEWYGSAGDECSRKNLTALFQTIANLKIYSEGLEVENKRLNDAILRCREGEK